MRSSCDTWIVRFGFGSVSTACETTASHFFFFVAVTVVAARPLEFYFTHDFIRAEQERQRAKRPNVPMSTVPPPAKVTIKSAHLVAAWSWDVKDDTCGICRHLFNACCPQCKIPGDDCAIVTGKCLHSFHMHCIEQWTSRSGESPQCPMCRQDWDYNK